MSAPVRASDGMRQTSVFVVVATITIIAVRGYLALTGYPQIGGRSNLHIAHALFGGALMIVAAMIGWLFIGRRRRRA